jgi:hypothetical protein
MAPEDSVAGVTSPRAALLEMPTPAISVSAVPGGHCPHPAPLLPTPPPVADR